MTLRFHFFRLAPLAMVSLLGAACSSEDSQGDDDGTGGAGSEEDGGSQSGGSGNGGGGNQPEGGTAIEGCDAVVGPSDNDTESVQTALIEAMSNDTICLEPGTYSFTNELSVAEHQGLTLKGTGESPEDVVLDFAGQTTGDDGVFVTADGFTIENVWVKNTTGNGIVIKADDSVFRNLKVSWDAGSVQENGAYAVYPTNCNRTLVENVDVSGASDAGVYVGQCRDAIVRNNKAYANVLGIEIENTIGADVYGNEVYDNSTGILVDLLPFKELKESNGALVRDNEIYDNNRANFAKPGGVIASVPAGTGLMVLAASNTEVRGNTITGHQGPAILVVSYDIVDVLLGTTSNDPETDRYPKGTYLHDNTMSDNGTMPTGAYEIIGSPTEAVLWDGIVDPDLADAAAMELCLGTAEAMSFRNFGGQDPENPMQSTDTTPHECTREPLPELSF